ncbi:hypothetical protein BH09PSE6_BH09PSE6_20510 [soil metagenome]
MKSFQATTARVMKAGLGIALVGGLAACASVPAPTEQAALGKRAVEQASAAPATTQAAPVEIQTARDKLAKADRAMTDKDYVEARRWYEEAEADARLAEAKGAAATSQQAMNELQTSMRALRDEINTQSTINSNTTVVPAR